MTSPAHGKRGEQLRVRCLLDLVLGCGKLFFELCPLLAQLRSPLVDVADQVLIGLIEQLKAAQSSLALEPDLAEFAAQRSEVLLALSTSFLPKIPDPVVE